MEVWAPSSLCPDLLENYISLCQDAHNSRPQKADLDVDDIYTLLYKCDNNVATALDACECARTIRPLACFAQTSGRRLSLAAKAIGLGH